MTVAPMMSLKWTPPLSLTFLLQVSGIVVAQNDWSRSICAVRRSTVTVGCSYTPIYTNSTVTEVKWSRYVLPDAKPLDMFSGPTHSVMVQYHNETRNDCSLRMTDVEQNDRGRYYLIFNTSAGEVFQDKQGVELTVTALRVHVIPSKPSEGNKVTLKCVTTCRLTETPTFIWYKRWEKISSGGSSDLLLPSVSQKDAGDYICSAQEGSYRSPASILVVQPGDRNVRVKGGYGRNFLVSLTVIVCAVAAVLAVLYYMRKKSQKRSDNVNAAEETYITPDPISRSSNDIYNTLANVYANSDNDTYTTLDPQNSSSSGVYNTLAEIPNLPDDTYTAPDSITVSSDYSNLPAEM